MDIRALYRLTRTFRPVTNETGWQHVNNCLSHGLIPWSLYKYWQNARTRDYLAKDRAYHWHPIIRTSRFALLGQNP